MQPTRLAVTPEQRVELERRERSRRGRADAGISTTKSGTLLK